VLSKASVLKVSVLKVSVLYFRGKMSGDKKREMRHGALAGKVRQLEQFSIYFAPPGE
jgi:hypothetical protein